jgi:hypothetical protein
VLAHARIRLVSGQALLLARPRRRPDELFAQEGEAAGAQFKPEPG